MTSEPSRSRLVSIHQVAAVFFRRQLAGSWAPAYLAARGFGPAVQRRWQMGYASPGRSALTRHLQGLGWPDAIIEASGLARVSRRGALIDTFCDRAMLPIHSREGDVI